MANYKTIEQLDAGITKALFDPKGRGVAELLTLKKLALGGGRNDATQNPKATGIKTIKTMLEEGGPRARVIKALAKCSQSLNEDALAKLFVQVDEELDAKRKELGLATENPWEPAAEGWACKMAKGEGSLRKRKPSTYCS